MKKLEFIEYVGKLAHEDMKRSKILASLTTAQAILESGYGTSELATKAYALFGIKKNGWTGKTYAKQTSEFVNGSYIQVVAEFRAYDSWEQSITDHSDYLLTREIAPGVLRYDNLIGETDYKEACRKIKEDGYATSPTYTERLIKLIEQYDLTKFDAKETNDVKKIYLDAGHGYNTAGKRTPDGIREWSLNSAVCNQITKNLKGYNVKVIRTDDTTGKTDVALSTRINKAINGGADVLVSIHHNALSGKWGSHTGVETYTDATYPTPGDVKLATLIQSKLAKETGLKNRGIKKADFVVINTGKITAVLAEGGFMDSTIDKPIITSIKGQTAYAKAVSDALIEFLGLEKTGEIVKPDPKPEQSTKWKVGDKVKFNGIYTSSMSSKKLIPYNPSGTITRIYPGAKNPYLIDNVVGFVNDSVITGGSSTVDSRIKVGDKVKVLKAETFDGKPFKTYYSKYDVIDVKGDRVVIGIKSTVTCAIHIKNIQRV